MLKMEDTLYKLDINFLFHLIVSPYGRIFNEEALFMICKTSSPLLLLV